MSREVFDDVDKLILEKWTEVSGLVDAYERVRDKVREQFELVGDRLRDWGVDQDLEIRSDIKAGEFSAFQKDWLRPDKDDQPWASLIVGGFVLEDAFGSDESKIYAAVYCSGGKRGRHRKDAFSENLKKAVGPKVTSQWSVDTDRSCPMNLYLEGISAKSALLDPKQFQDVVLQQFNQLSEFIEPIAASVKKMAQLPAA